MDKYFLPFDQPSQERKSGIYSDEDFIHYLQMFATLVRDKIQVSEDPHKNAYYRGMMYALKSICDVYETLLKKEPL